MLVRWILGNSAIEEAILALPVELHQLLVIEVLLGNLVVEDLVRTGNDSTLDTDVEGKVRGRSLYIDVRLAGGLEQSKESLLQCHQIVVNFLFGATKLVILLQETVNDLTILLFLLLNHHCKALVGFKDENYLNSVMVLCAGCHFELQAVLHTVSKVVSLTGSNLDPRASLAGAVFESNKL